MNADELVKKVSKIRQILGVLERCFGRLGVILPTVSEALDRVSDEWIDFYYAKLVRKI